MSEGDINVLRGRRLADRRQSRACKSNQCENRRTNYPAIEAKLGWRNPEKGTIRARRLDEQGHHRADNHAVAGHRNLTLATAGRGSLHEGEQTNEWLAHVDRSR